MFWAKIKVPQDIRKVGKDASRKKRLGAIDLEEAHNRVDRRTIWWVLELCEVKRRLVEAV